MTVFRGSLRRVDLLAWLIIVAIAISLAGGAIAGRIEIRSQSFLVPIALTLLLALGGAKRNEARLAAILTSTAHLVGFAAVAAPLSYIAATASFPLHDATLEAWDRQLGIDWTQLVTFVAGHPGLQKILLIAYSSFALQCLTTLFALGIAGHLARLKIFVGAFIATTLVTIAVSAIYPAAGPWLFLEIQSSSLDGFLPASATSWPVFLGLRAGTLHTVYGLHSEGIITFPSLHAACAVLFLVALWPVKQVRWLALCLNILMLIATPAYGSHYVVDVIAGIVVALGCWFVIAYAAERRVRISISENLCLPSPQTFPGTTHSG
jgi:hypothetical protein